MARRNAPSRRGGKQNTFFGGAAVLALGILTVKLIGMFYKIPLVNIIGDQGSTDFTNAYNIYSVLLTISTAGLPVAVSKLVSEANAQGRRNQVHRVFRLALVIFLALGAASFLVMFFRADWLAAAMNDTKAAPGIKAMAPAVVCVGCLSALRGYSQGHMNMTPTSVSQIIEALCKLVVGLSLAYGLTRAGQPPEIAAAGAITGVTVGTMVALGYMVLNFMITRSREPRLSRDVPDDAAAIIRDILCIAVPVTLGSSMVGIVTVVDASLVQGQLQRVLLEKPECWALYTDYVDFAPLEGAIAAWKDSLTAGAPATMAALSAQVEAELKAGTAQSAGQALYNTLESVSRTLYGNYSGALTIYNLPNALMAAITASVIPAVSGALTRRNRREASRISAAALRVTALLACPMGVGLFVMGTPIMQMLYPSLEKEIAGPLLSALGLANILVCLVLVCNSILQAHGFVTLPVLVMVLGGGLKIAANYIVVAMPGVGIYGAPVGNLPCFGLCLLLDLLIISRAVPRLPRYGQVFAKPVLASVLMGGAAWAVYGLGSKISMTLGEKSLAAALASGKDPGGLGAKLCDISIGLQQVLGLSRAGRAICTLGAIGVAVIVYGILIVALRAITRDDLSLMPKGDKIARILGL